MLKTIALLKRKPGMSREAFIAYYEMHHAPLIRALTPGILSYRRNFVCDETVFPIELAGALEFDAVTEICYADRSAWDLAMAASVDPHNAARIAADEENFLDRSKTRYFATETYGDAAP